MARTTYDWEAIRAFYEQGRSIKDCKEKFGFSSGAWDRAVKRGDVVARPRASGPPGRTRTQVERLLAEGLSQAAIARHLGLTMPAISHHARALGVPARAECQSPIRLDGGPALPRCRPHRARVHGSLRVYVADLASSTSARRLVYAAVRGAHINLSRGWAASRSRPPERPVAGGRPQETSM